MVVNRIMSVMFIILIGSAQCILTAQHDHTQVHTTKYESRNNRDLHSGFFATLYGGRYTDRHLLDKVLMLKPIYYEDSWLKSLALGKIIYDGGNYYRLEIEVQFADHVGEQKHHEFNALAVFRLKYVTSSYILPFSFAFGNGLSYATETPKIEDRSRTNINASKLLNYLLLEVAINAPFVERWELVGRIHHRSGIFGLFNNVRGGSNVMAAGLRYYF